MKSRAMRVALGVCLALSLLACGGGGGGGLLPVPVPVAPPAPQPVDGNVSASFTPAAVRVERVSRQTDPTRSGVNVAVTYTGNRNIFIGLIQDGNLLEDYGTTLTGSTVFDVYLHFRATDTVGVQRGELRVRVCFDVDCAREVPGSPVRVALEIEVLPNIELPASITLQRTGRDPAPTLELPVALPAGVGMAELFNGADLPGSGISLAWTGSAIRVTTTQLRAGRYERELTLESTTDKRYRATTQVVYTVNPPPGGELPLQVDPPYSSALVEQGQVATQRLRVQRPTWTATLGAPIFDNSGLPITLRDLGNDEYELRFDAAGQTPGAFGEATLGFSAAPAGGFAQASFRATVTEAFGVGSGLSSALDADSTAAALRLSAPVTVGSGAPARWAARALTPGLRLLRASGTTGVDAVELEVDAAAVLATQVGYSGSVEVSIDRAGTVPVVARVSVENRVPRLTVALRGPLLPGSNVLYVDGAGLTSQLIRDRLLVTGATLRSATLPADTRFVGDMVVLRLELDGAVPGQDVVLRLPAPMLDVPVHVPVVAAPALTGAYATLPYAAWRLPQWSLRQGALYMGAPGKVARWSAAGAWNLSVVDLPDSEDAALFGDESRLLAVGGEKAWRLDPLTLAVVAQGSIASAPFWTGQSIDPRVPDAMGALAMAADGAVNAAIRYAGDGGVAMLGIAQRLPDLTGAVLSAGDVGTVGTAPPVPGERSVGLVRSTLGEAVLGQLPTGRLRLHRATERVPQLAQTLPAGVWARAVSDDGQRVLASNGVLWLRGAALPGTLDAALPAGHTVGGYGLSGHGRWGLVYLYRVSSEGGTPRARDAQLWVFDLSAAETSGVAAAPVLARLPLSDAVGCTVALTAGETCQHAASIVTAPGEGHAFVLGPRGVAAVPLDGVAAAAAAVRARAAAGPGWVPAGNLSGSAR
ncbi:MAG: hypothetical protein Q7U99_20300 [Rubrivivax sp.]|nr:hypothetical protein [Rubrivivax sp.]